VLFCFCISVVTASQLDNFVSVIGAVACIPLAFTFPAFFHACSEERKAIAESRSCASGVSTGNAEEGQAGYSLLAEHSNNSIAEELDGDGVLLERGWCIGPWINRAIVLYGMVASCVALVGAVGEWVGRPVLFPVIHIRL